jgi:NAD(P)-dependent dehydrogenase (short-subunit alcohol dehydrogenase family)
MSLAIADKTVLVTGANRGLGRALVDEALRRGAKRVYAASREPIVVPDDRVTPLILDVTDTAQIQEAVNTVESLDILINNAGVSVPDDLSDRSAFERHLAVNLYRTLDVTQAFVPSLTRSHGVVVNVVSLGAVAAVPVLPAYSVSKAASLSVTQSLRVLLAGRGVSVYAVMPGPIDTDMGWRRSSSARTPRWSKPSRSPPNGDPVERRDGHNRFAQQRSVRVGTGPRPDRGRGLDLRTHGGCRSPRAHWVAPLAGM